jgi:hypothetical protein
MRKKTWGEDSIFVRLYRSPETQERPSLGQVFLSLHYLHFSLHGNHGKALQ